VFLAWKEIARNKLRFAMLVLAIALLVFLILFQWTIRNGLVNSFIGGIRNQNAPVLVYTVDGQRFLQASVILPDVEAQIRATDGVGAAGRLAQGTFTVSTSELDQADASLIGVEDPTLGMPATLMAGRLPSAPEEVVVSDVDAADGFDIGDTVTVIPGGLQLTVVGLAADVQINVTPTMFATYQTYLDAVASRNPDGATPLPNAIAVRPAAGVSDAELVRRLNAIGPDVDALTRRDAADNAPGVDQVITSFWIIFALYAIVVPLVAGLFFLIITFQKSAALTLLRAIGASQRRLVASLLLQAAMMMAAGIVIGCALYAWFTSVGRLGGISIRYEGAAVTWWSVGLMAAGLLSAMVAGRRVGRLDPADAVQGAGIR
jgi:putative ABC transport system permease protein